MSRIKLHLNFRGFLKNRKNRVLRELIFAVEWILNFSRELIFAIRPYMTKIFAGENGFFK